VILWEPKLLYKIESDFDAYFNKCILYYYPMIYTKDIAQMLNDARTQVFTEKINKYDW
jgi:hypothetical protein